jgi:exonuclease III
MSVHKISSNSLNDLKVHIDCNTVILGDFNTPLSPTDTSSKKINKESLEPNDSKDQMELTDVYRIFHPTTAQYTFFLAAHGTFFKIDHILGHKARISK